MVCLKASLLLHSFFPRNSLHGRVVSLSPGCLPVVGPGPGLSFHYPDRDPDVERPATFRSQARTGFWGRSSNA